MQILNGYFVIATVFFNLSPFPTICIKVIHYQIYGKLNPALQILEPNFTNPSDKSQMNDGELGYNMADSYFWEY